MNMTVHPSASSSLISSHLPACLSLSQLACGIGDVHYCLDVWELVSHVPAPLGVCVYLACLVTSL